MSWEEIAQPYVDMIRRSVRLTKTASAVDKAAATITVKAVFERIAEDSKKKWDKPLTEGQEEALSDAIAESLGVPREKIRKAVKSASNDSHTDLVIHTSDIINSIKGN